MEIYIIASLFQTNVWVTLIIRMGETVIYISVKEIYGICVIDIKTRLCVVIKRKHSNNGLDISRNVVVD